MDKKVAVYLCRGCDIGNSLDIEALIDNATEEHPVDITRDHECMCGEEGCQLIRQDIQDGVNAVVVAACSPRFMTDVFTFDNVFTERVNLREQVVWSHEPNDEDTQMMAEDYLRMGIVKAEKAEVPEPFDEEIDKTILVVGGGSTGISAALDAAGAGYDVVLVEKEAQLGGWMAKFSKQIPHTPPYATPQPVDLGQRIAEVESHDRITVHTGASVEKITGQPGQFDVTLKANGSSGEFRVGSIVQATGWRPYDATRLGHLGYGGCANVITNVQMEEMIASGQITRPSDGKPAKRVAFIQCAGSRDEDHLPYCSAVCCRVTIKQALIVTELDGEAEAYVLYKDIRAPGQYEDFYR
ncbi:MAG: CoB--CoM heterodisulfide reductase iron-sulfur subunit A family protein, partial [Gemmatimonadetes bacterium]|nr:CoB--CoM heterodisulfide reductase iron-sulfur subunit A family protein [Gemmatimonadota bacterium]